MYFLHGDCTCSLQSDADMILPSRVSRSNWSPCACDQKSTSSQSEHAEWSRNYAYFGVQYLHHNDKTIQLYFAHLLHCSKQQLLSRGAKKVERIRSVLCYWWWKMQYALWFFCPAQVIGRRAKLVLVEGGDSSAAAVLGPGIRPCPDPARIFNIFHFIKIFSFTLWIISRTKAMKQQHPVAQQQICRMRLWKAMKIEIYIHQWMS